MPLKTKTHHKHKNTPPKSHHQKPPPTQHKHRNPNTQTGTWSHNTPEKHQQKPDKQKYDHTKNTRSSTTEANVIQEANRKNHNHITRHHPNVALNKLAASDKPTITSKMPLAQRHTHLQIDTKPYTTTSKPRHPPFREKLPTPQHPNTHNPTKNPTQAKSVYST